VARVTGVDVHYFFPPARAYPLNRFLFRLKSDAALRERFLADAEAAMADHGLNDDARVALATFERDALVALGAHPYLVFMARLRLDMTRTPGTFENF
jgi:hypothetical protein